LINFILHVLVYCVQLMLQSSFFYRKFNLQRSSQYTQQKQNLMT